MSAQPNGFEHRFGHIVAKKADWKLQMSMPRKPRRSLKRP